MMSYERTKAERKADELGCLIRDVERDWEPGVERERYLTELRKKQQVAWRSIRQMREGAR